MGGMSADVFPPVDVLPVHRATPLAVTLSFWVDGAQHAQVLEVELPAGGLLDRLTVAVGSGPEASLLLSVPFGLEDRYPDDDEDLADDEALADRG